MNDPNYRAKKEAEEARKAAAKVPAPSPQKPELPKMGPSPADSLAIGDTPAVSDSLAVTDSLAVSDSLGVTDSLAVEPLDTTKVGFLEALRNVRIFKKNMQVVCDSLVSTCRH